MRRATGQAWGQDKTGYFNGVGLSSFRAVVKVPARVQGKTLKGEDRKWWEQ